MAVTSRNLRTNQPERWSGRRVLHVPTAARSRPQPAARQDQARGSVLNTLIWIAVVVLCSLMIGTISGWIGTLRDDLRYGRPRVSHLVAAVGHETSQDLPTEFIAVNLNRRVLILEFPGGDATQMRTIQGPYLFGSGEDLTPVTLDLQDVNSDRLPDLLVNIKNEQLVYINQPDGFRMITAEEQQQLPQSAP